MEEELSSRKRTARIAGFMYFMVAVTGAFSMIYVPSSLIVRGDVTATVQNIMASKFLFRMHNLA